jgi:putative flippase GtrA
MRYIKGQAARFLVAGGLNTMLTYLIYLMLLNFVGYLMAFSLTFVIGVFLAYFLNTAFVFKTNFSLSKIFRYPLIYFVQYIIGMILVIFLVDILLIDKRIAPLVNVIVLTPITFLLNRWILTNNSPHSPP